MQYGMFPLKHLIYKSSVMETNQVLHADVLDILFEGRNKMYGAYELRKTYNNRLKVALAVMVSCCLFTFLATVAGKSKYHQSTALLVKDDVTLQQVEPPPLPAPPPPPPPPPAPKQIMTVKFTTPVLVDNTETPPPTQTTLDDIAIGNIDNLSGEMKDVVAPPVENTGVVETPPKVIEHYETEFKTVQVQARFPGGADAWKRFLERNLKSELPLDNGAPAGIYSVVVSFLVDKEGNVSEVKALNDPGYGTAVEAVRAIQSGPKWIPALQNGRNVIYRQKQTITFRVEEGQ
jgi:protein TonB